MKVSSLNINLHGSRGLEIKTQLRHYIKNKMV